ncbi:probable metal-nicotianamine transporter YSL8 [Dioscorea cayenensis subsp. rotundata]|uniref:Probable metal-nicotianamine transporter YSL8 n=1 Tax=Dioscorea cayennensis subsp. rotundata TaxID=55577 RepID=A0AB40C3K0_DIOCR|nr:probable metal-nicotianamine transporter YSL8 [Dioscorea cayenensis subsp. rotundata]
MLERVRDGDHWPDHPNGIEPDNLSVDQMLQSDKVPKWTEQLTVRAFIVSLLVGTFLTIIILRLSITTGIVPAFNIVAGLLGFFLVKSWTRVLEATGLSRTPFTRQENTIIQTCIVACTSIGFSGGFGSYILAMSSQVANEIRDPAKENSTKDPSESWMIPFLFMVSFTGLFTISPIAKMTIIQHRLTYPTGSAVAHLINNFHTPQGALLARKQVRLMLKSFTGSFFWAAYSWLFTGGPNCGWSSFPLFGTSAYLKRFYFDFSLSNIAVGMICSHLVNFSLLLGAIISWGFLWPYIKTKEGLWYPAKLDASSFQGAFGYKIFISIAVILGDGFYHLVEVLLRSLHNLRAKRKQRGFMSTLETSTSDLNAVTNEERLRTNHFLQEQIPTTFAVGGYLLCFTISIFGLPNIFPQLMPHHILAAYLMAPLLGFCNAYGCGVTNWSLAPTYGKFAIMIFSAWVGAKAGGVIVGLVACGIVMTISNSASDLIQDLKTGYLTLSSPRSMFISQFIGTIMGCIMAPVIFWFINKSMHLGKEGSLYSAPYAKVYRAMALLSTDGLSKLPKNCISLCVVFFFGAVLINAMREGAKRKKWWFYKYIPSPIGMAIPFYLGGFFTVSMCIGSIIRYRWEKMNPQGAAMFVPVMASGMMCGESIWLIPAALLSMYHHEPPMCLRFLTVQANNLLDYLLYNQQS